MPPRKVQATLQGRLVTKVSAQSTRYGPASAGETQALSSDPAALEVEGAPAAEVLPETGTAGTETVPEGAGAEAVPEGAGAEAAPEKAKPPSKLAQALRNQAKRNRAIEKDIILKKQRQQLDEMMAKAQAAEKNAKAAEAIAKAKIKEAEEKNKTAEDKSQQNAEAAAEKNAQAEAAEEKSKQDAETAAETTAKAKAAEEKAKHAEEAAAEKTPEKAEQTAAKGGKKAQPKPKPEAKVPKAKAQPKPKAAPKAKTETKAKAAPKAKAETKAKAAPKAKAEVETVDDEVEEGEEEEEEEGGFEKDVCVNPDDVEPTPKAKAKATSKAKSAPPEPTPALKAKAKAKTKAKSKAEATPQPLQTAVVAAGEPEGSDDDAGPAPLSKSDKRNFNKALFNQDPERGRKLNTIMAEIEALPQRSGKSQMKEALRMSFRDKGWDCLKDYSAKRSLEEVETALVQNTSVTLTEILAKLGSAKAVQDGVARGDVEEVEDSDGRLWYRMASLRETKGMKKTKTMASDAPGACLQMLNVGHDLVATTRPTPLQAAMEAEKRVPFGQGNASGHEGQVPAALPLALTDASLAQKAQLKLSDLSQRCAAAQMKAQLAISGFPSEGTKTALKAKAGLQEALETLNPLALDLRQAAQTWSTHGVEHRMTKLDYDAVIIEAQAASDALAELQDAYNMAHSIRKAGSK